MRAAAGQCFAGKRAPAKTVPGEHAICGVERERSLPVVSRNKSACPCSARQLDRAQLMLEWMQVFV